MDRRVKVSTANTNPRAPFPIPAGFPVRWDDPSDAFLHWRFGQSHWFTQMTPFDFTIDGRMVWQGMDAARRHYGQAAQRTEVRRINTYYYLAQNPLPLSEDERARIARESDARIEAAIATQRPTWENDWLPELRGHHAWWEAFDRASATDAALAMHGEESIRRMARLWNLHFLILTPGYAAIALFQQLYVDLFGDTPHLELQVFLQGFTNKTTETGRALWHVAKVAETIPEVARILAEMDPSNVMPRLRAMPAAEAFVQAFDRAIAEYGQRYENWLPSNPSWVEDPTPAVKSLREMLWRPDADPDARLTRLANEREEATARARARLAALPESDRARFEFLLPAAQLGVVLTEDHGYWIDTRGTYKVRRVFVEIGHRLTRRGTIERPDDVFMLWPDEALAAVAADTSSDHREIIAERRAEMDRFASIRPPMELGTPAPPAPPPLDAVGRASARFRSAKALAGDETMMRGVGASAGIVRARARIARRLGDTSRIQPGEILIAESTSPAWTPLFASVGAVVTESGGMLGHCAIVAREYRIPAVVGVAGATTRIRDGELIEVNGTEGTVRVISAP
ncbi:MAG: hypothetical protein EPO26_16245 [Chloroflexota bacterium]|nr:MAG: hypothetical protein EPO26_16245 [Chloroflexota bacterium]